MALEAYDECPEQMLLALGQLWHAFGGIAGTLIPLLPRYSPEIPKRVFQSPLLSVRRSKNLEMYIDMRHQNVELGSIGIWDL